MRACADSGVPRPASLRAGRRADRPPDGALCILPSPSLPVPVCAVQGAAEAGASRLKGAATAHGSVPGAETPRAARILPTQPPAQTTSKYSGNSAATAVTRWAPRPKYAAKSAPSQEPAM